MKISPYTIDRKNPFAIISVICMALCAVLRITYFTLRPTDIAFLAVHLFIPLAAAVIFIAAILFSGQKHIGLTCLSVLFGIVFFIIKAFTFQSLIHTVLCIILYIAVLLLYTLTVFGIIPTKKLLYPLFSLPLLYHIFVEDMQLYILADPPVPFIEWLPEISVLLIMSGLLAVSIAMKKAKLMFSL